jgi:sulfatase maturation enzyme AslB (radical SAM superfamily)
MLYFIKNLLNVIRKLIPDNIYYSKLLIPARIMLGNKIKNSKRGSLRFDVHIADHCNLNCKGCEHFSPLAPKHFIDIKKYENDCIQLVKLSGANDYGGGGGGSISEIALLGGEPLLNPQINDAIKISRSYFPAAAINILTNGLLLKNQTKEFWDCCRTNNVCIKISGYPVGIDYSFLMDTAKKYGVQLQFWGDVKLASQKWKELPIESMGRWHQLPIDLEGRQNPKKSNALCYASNFCFQLVEGKLYKCWRIAYAKDFNNYFDKQLEVTEYDYVDIYKAASIDEILEKLCKPAPFCRYCKMDAPKLVEWGKSKREINEWIAD